MELLNKITIKNLKLNKKRTIATIIGIMLATALITGVATLVFSFYTSLLEHTKNEYGNYHYEFLNVPVEEIKNLESTENVESIYAIQNVGYSIFENDFSQKEYLHLIGNYNNDFKQFNLLEGRFPQNANEIAISKHIETQGKVELKIGQEITLSIGKRFQNGEELDQHYSYLYNEEIVSEFTKTYKIVGIIERPNYGIEPEQSAGYTVVTYLDANTEQSKFNVYLKFEDFKQRNETTAQILEIDEETFNKLKTANRRETEEKLRINENNKYEYYINYTLMQIENGSFNDQTMIMVLSVALVVIGIIIITSVYCIRNSFEISITEKIRQYGMLSSIGATPKQIGRNVLYEALILGVIAIPLGIILGIASIYLLLKATKQILSETLFGGMEILFSTSGIVIGVAILLGIFTIYLSAIKSARKASKISPIEAIRSNQDIKIKSKKIKSPKYIKKLFGVGGNIAYKSLKRNNKKYRTTVVSIIVSVATFIAITSFVEYAFKVSEFYYEKKDYNLSINGEDFEQLKEIVEDLNIKSYSLTRRDVLYTEEDSKQHYSQTLIDYNYSSVNDRNITLSVVSFGEQEYKRLIDKCGFKYEDIKNKAILYDYERARVEENGQFSYKIIRVYDFKKGDIIEGFTYLDNEKKHISVEIGGITDIVPMGLDYVNAKSNRTSFLDLMDDNNIYQSVSAYLFVSDEFFEEKGFYDEFSARADLYMDVENDIEVEEYIEENYSFEVNNLSAQVRENKATWLVISIFIYGFIIVISLIGVTNIFNTITTNMELRQKEFANLKSIGMTKKEFNRMIRLESLFYGLKSLIIGVPLGVLLSYLISRAVAKNIEMEYMLPLEGIIISILAVFILIGIIMKYSLNKINKQNIIETIRKDNI